MIGAAVGALLVTVGSLPFLGTEFMPRLDEGALLIETRRIPSTSLQEGVAMSNVVERTLRRFPEVRSVVTNLGRPETATEVMGLFQADVYVLFHPRSKWKARSQEELITRMDSALAEIPGLDYDFSAPMAMRLDEVISGVRTQLGVKIFGDSLPLLQAKGEEIKALMERIPGAADVSVRVSAGAMQVDITPDREALARYGLNVSDVRDALQAGVGGVEASEVIDGRRRFPIVVRLAESYRNSPEALSQLLIPMPEGGHVTLQQVAQLQVGEGPERIEHEGGLRYVVVQSNVRGRDLGGYANEVRRKVADAVKLPEGYFVAYGGQFENQERAMKRLAVIVPAVLVIIFGLLYATFRNATHAALVMLNVPFALIGGIGALWARGINLNLSAAVGFIALFGIAMLNGVVLIAYINELRAGGTDLRRAIEEGASTRLRPVLMTALVAGVGFLPMALSTSAGAEVQRPLATVVIGGLITSTLLTLLVLPSMYVVVEAFRARRAASSK